MRQGSLDSFFASRASPDRHKQDSDIVAGYLAALPPKPKCRLGCSGAGNSFAPHRVRKTSEHNGTATARTPATQTTVTTAIASSPSFSSSHATSSSRTISGTTSAGRNRRTKDRAITVEYDDHASSGSCNDWKRPRCVKEDDISEAETWRSSALTTSCPVSSASASSLLVPNTFRLANIACIQNMSSRLYTHYDTFVSPASSSGQLPDRAMSHRSCFHRHGYCDGNVYDAIVHADARNYFYRLQQASVTPYRVYAHAQFTTTNVDTNVFDQSLWGSSSRDSRDTIGAHRGRRDVGEVAVHDIIFDSQEEYTIAVQRARLQLFHTQSWAQTMSRGGAVLTEAAPILTLESSLVQNPYTQPIRSSTSRTNLDAGSDVAAGSGRQGSGFSSTQFLGSSMYIICGYTRRSKIDIFDLEDVDESDCCPIRAYDLTRVCQIPSFTTAVAAARPVRAQHDGHSRRRVLNMDSWEDGSASMNSGAAAATSASATPYVNDVITLSEHSALAALSTGQSILIDLRSAHVLPCTPPPPSYDRFTQHGTPPCRHSRSRCDRRNTTWPYHVADAHRIHARIDGGGGSSTTVSSTNLSISCQTNANVCANPSLSVDEDYLFSTSCAPRAARTSSSSSSANMMTMMYTSRQQCSAMTSLAHVPTVSDMQVVCGMSDGAVLLWDVRHTRRAVSARYASSHAVGRMRLSNPNDTPRSLDKKTPRVWFTNFTGQLVALELSRSGAIHEVLAIPLASTSHSDESVFLSPPRVAMSAQEDFVLVPDVAGNALVVLDWCHDAERGRRRTGGGGSSAADWLYCAGESDSVEDDRDKSAQYASAMPDRAAQEEDCAEECMGCRECGLQTSIACRIAMNAAEMQLSCCATTGRDGLIYLGDTEGGVSLLPPPPASELNVSGRRT